MKNVSALLLVVLIGLGCQRAPKSSTITPPEPFDLTKKVQQELDSIRTLSPLLANHPDTQEGHDKNDSITRAISRHTEHIIDFLIESYGKEPTDTILTVLGNLDNSGYIPIQLYERFDEDDFSTAIGKRAKEAYKAYVDEKSRKVNKLKHIDWLDQKLALHRIAEEDTITLHNILLEHKGYKVLDFWATWCAPCRSFNKRFQKHYPKYRDKGIAFYGIGIRVDSESERAKFLTAVQNDNTPWPQFIDLNNETYRIFETNAVPYQVLLDENNQVVKIVSHDIENELDEVLKQLETQDGLR